MPSIADLLGITWDEQPTPATAVVEGFTLSGHARSQCESKGIDPQAALDAADRPGHAYPNGRFPGQMRHVRGEVVAVVDPVRRVVVTVYANVVETDLRQDQRSGAGAVDALAFERARRRPTALLDTPDAVA